MPDDQPREPRARSFDGQALRLAGVALVALLVASGVLHSEPGAAPSENAVTRITARRCEHNPLIIPASSPSLGNNINGPSLLRVPDWVEDPLGRYYLYFGHHHGKFIRLAYADELCGAWTIHEPGVLPIKTVPSLRRHLASPDVHVDETRREILLYVHGKGRPDGQETALAVSSDGLRFTALEQRMGRPYLKRFEWENELWAVSSGGYRASPLGWRSYGALLHSAGARLPFFEVAFLLPRMRHAAVLVRDGRVLVFSSRKGDAPERLLVSSLDLSAKPTLSPPLEVLRPEAAYEGADLPLAVSKTGPTEPAHQLRDPHVYEEAGRTWLFYATAGEAGIGLAELEIELAD